MCQMVHTVYFFVCKLSARPQFSIFHFQLSILKNFRSGIICFYITNCLHEQGMATRRITNKKVGKQKFCIENLLPDFNF